MTEESREVAEARARILDYTSDRWEHLSPRLDALVEAVRKDERERFPIRLIEAARSHVMQPPRNWQQDNALDYLNHVMQIMAAPAEGGTEG